MSNVELFTIGQVALIAEVNIETIRYYQRIKLIPTPLKPKEGYRKYSATVIKQIRFIKRAKQLGFSLEEIAELLLMEHGQCKDVRLKAEQKRSQIQQQISDLRILEGILSDLIDSCCKGKGTTLDGVSCPIIDSLIDK